MKEVFFEGKGSVFRYLYLFGFLRISVGQFNVFYYLYSIDRRAFKLFGYSVLSSRIVFTPQFLAKK